MYRSATSPARPAELSACENEPIQIPGAIQPHGALLAIDEQSGRIVNVSANTGEFIGREAAELLNARVDSLLGVDALAKLSAAADEVRGFGQAYTQDLAVGNVERAFDIIVHRTSGVLVAELERAHRLPDGRDIFVLAHMAVARIQACDTIEALVEDAAREIARISGYERVMIYRFDRDWNG
ncbi:MAG TPA: hypothetical protein VFN49_13765, partial [Candidatus Aquilonibacter sp.]|nr:hypothetical protein [Candidatus Aquilonibacter sp.]